MKTPCHIRSPLILLLAWAAGLASLAGAAVDGSIDWKIKVGDLVFASPAIGPSGEVVVASEIGRDPGPYDGAVYSLNPDGSVRWVFTGATDWVDSSPTIGMDGTVYFGSWDGSLYALDGASGALKWKYPVGNAIIASPAIGPDGSIYVGAQDGIMYALRPDGSLRWSFEAGTELGPVAAGAVLSEAGDRLYFGTETGVLYCLSTANGSAVWSFPVPQVLPLAQRNAEGLYAILAPPAIGPGGSVYFTCENGMVFGVSPDGSRINYNYFSINADPQNPEESIRSGPIVDEFGIVYVAGQDGYLYALGTDNQLSIMVELWELYVGDVFYCTPALDESRKIIIAGYAGSSTTGAATDFSCVDIASQTITWETRINGLNDSSPNIAPDGSIYIGAHDGYLYKLQGNAALDTTGWNRRQGNRRQTGWIQDLRSMELVDFLPEITRSRDGWVVVPWFGPVAETALPWISHSDHGLIFLSKSSQDSLQFYDPRLEAWFTALPGFPNLLFRHDTAQWLYHNPGSSIWSARWFYDFSLQAWVDEYSLSQ